MLKDAGHAMRFPTKAIVASVVFSVFPGAVQVFAQDILLSDFEETNYAWLPGGVWTATGNCFGLGPAQGTLTNQQTVGGYLGHGLVNTFLDGDGNYYVGQFDGNAFTAQYGPFSIRGGNSFAAGQTFNNMPASDGRRILIANATGNYPGMPFNGGMDFPVELTLNTWNGQPRLFINPVKEVALLRYSTNSWPAQPMVNGVNVMSGAMGEAYELDAQFVAHRV